MFGLDALGSGQAFLLAFLIGCGFGFALERAGFGSSRRLAGIFYFLIFRPMRKRQKQAKKRKTKKK